METYFAEPKRETTENIKKQVKFISQHQFVKGLMSVVQGLFAVLNNKRQIIALNDHLLYQLGASDTEEILGLRLGESVHCVHAKDTAAGCGTGPYCSSCGAAISMVSALKNKTSKSKVCSIRAQQNGKEDNLYFKVKSTYLELEEEQLILIFMEDITYKQKIAELERVFFHDIKNKMSGIINGCEILKMQAAENKEVVDVIYDLTYQMVREIEFQRRMINENNIDLKIDRVSVNLQNIYKEIERTFYNHSVADHKILKIPRGIKEFQFVSDMSIIIRVLTNMVKNAFEATEKGGFVSVNHSISDHHITFSVWNDGKIEDAIADQIFNRNFTTKQKPGHGFGTFSMKLLGEKILGGKVDFNTDASEGTTFQFDIPLEN